METETKDTTGINGHRRILLLLKKQKPSLLFAFCNFLSTATSCYLNLVAVLKQQLDKWDLMLIEVGYAGFMLLGLGAISLHVCASVTYFLLLRLAGMIHCRFTAEHVFLFVHDLSATLQHHFLFVYTGPTRSSWYTWRKGESLLCIFNAPFEQHSLAVSYQIETN